MLFCFNGYSQIYIEYVSPKTDSMALINKTDIDIINKVFAERNVLDSLNNVNHQIINHYENEISILDSVILKQNNIILNDKEIIDQLESDKFQMIDNYKKELKSETNKKISYQTLTGVSFLVIILLILV